jgi:hypothetical protein
MTGMTNRLLVAAMTVALCEACAIAAETPASGPAVGGDDGFVSIFNGKDMTGWEGDPNLWSAVDGCIRGQTTPAKKAYGNTFCIWRGGQPKNFVLKIKFRIQSGNSGVQYRSQEMAGNKKPGTKNRWGILGYQAEVANLPGHVGFLYDESRRGSLGLVGDLTVVDVVDGKAVHKIPAKVCDTAAIIKAGYYKDKDWNDYSITCRGNHITQVLNGYLTVELIDNEQAKRTLEGLLALQIHAGDPMIVDFKDIRLKTLPEQYGEALLLFNGKDTTGWALIGEDQKDNWSVLNGALCTKGKTAGYVRTVDDYTNYVLRMQLRYHEPYYAGVLLRAGPDKVWPKAIMVDGRKGAMGDLWSLSKFPMKTDPARTKDGHAVRIGPAGDAPADEWNQFEVYLNKGDLNLTVNEVLQNAATDCQEVPGKICLPSDGGPVEYRNIVLIPIGSETDKAAATK